VPVRPRCDVDRTGYGSERNSNLRLSGLEPAWRPFLARIPGMHDKGEWPTTDQLWLIQRGRPDALDLDAKHFPALKRTPAGFAPIQFECLASESDPCSASFGPIQVQALSLDGSPTSGPRLTPTAAAPGGSSGVTPAMRSLVVAQGCGLGARPITTGFRT